MSWLLLILGLIAAPPVMTSADSPALRDSVQTYYAHRDVQALQTMLERTTSREIELLCRYRLYPLTRDEQYIADIPAELSEASARELALLSGLWGYRTSDAPVYLIPKYGRRSVRLLDAARSLDRDEPFVHLVEGQSLLFRPAIFGGDKEAALQSFRRLEHVLDAYPGCGISETEAQTWTWRALREVQAEEAERVKRDLLSRPLPPLYEAFLLDPP